MSIETLIKLNGPLTIANFMQEAMFNPKKGYYKTHNPIGKNQDFITSPEISSIFGHLIAGYYLEFILKSTQEIAFVEMGAGLGTLFYDICNIFIKISQKLGKKDELLSKLSFNIIETSPELTNIQQKKLAKLNLRINWYQDFTEFQENNKNRQIYFLANELFDCFEIHQFSKKNYQWQEIMVDLKENKLNLVLENFVQKKHEFIEKIAAENEIDGNKDEIIFEHSFTAQKFMNQLSLAIKNQGGICLIIDYGYFNSPLKSTLQAIKNHKKSNIFDNIYQSDLTAHVNFKMLKKTSENNALASSLVSQEHFLKSLGIQEKYQALRKRSDKNESEIHAISRLTDPNQMGELFKCLIIWDSVL